VNVGDLQNFLRNLGALLEANKGATPAKDLQAVCEGLEPFKGRSVADFAHFLKVAEEYHRTGKIPETTGRKPSARKPAAPKAPKPARKKKDDVQAVETAAAALQRLYDRAPDAALSYEEIEKEVDRIDAEFDVEGLKAVAKKFGVTSTMKGKGDAKKKIRDRIADRKGHTERGQVITQQAVAPPPAPSAAPEEPDAVLDEEPSPGAPMPASQSVPPTTP
jgi:hypothetical protein